MTATKQRVVGDVRRNHGLTAGLRRELADMLGQSWLSPQSFEFLDKGVPSTDVIESEHALELRMDLPGVKPEDIEIQLEGNRLWVKAERHDEKLEDSQRVHHVERFTGSYARSFELPASINGDEVAANYEDGILTVTLPKVETSKAKKIKVKA